MLCRRLFFSLAGLGVVSAVATAGSDITAYSPKINNIIKAAEIGTFLLMIACA